MVEVVEQNDCFTTSSAASLMIEDIDGSHEDVELSKKLTEMAHLHNVPIHRLLSPNTATTVFSLKAVYASGVRLSRLLLRKEAIVYVAGIRWQPHWLVTKQLFQLVSIGAFAAP